MDPHLLMPTSTTHHLGHSQWFRDGLVVWRNKYSLLDGIHHGCEAWKCYSHVDTMKESVLAMEGRKIRTLRITLKHWINPL